MEENLNITVNLQDALNFINSEDFLNFIFNSTDMSIGFLISHILNQTITYMMQDDNLQNGEK